MHQFVGVQSTIKNYGQGTLIRGILESNWKVMIVTSNGSVITD